MLLMPVISGGKVAYFSSFTINRRVIEHPSKKFKLPREALFVIVLRTPTKELLKLPIFNSEHQKALNYSNRMQLFGMDVNFITT